MATVDLTKENFESVVTGNPMVIGRCPASALEQVLTPGQGARHG